MKTMFVFRDMGAGMTRVWRKRDWALTLLLTLVLNSGLGLPVQVWADDDYEHARRLRGAGDILPLESIIGGIKSDTSVRILEVELESENGRYIYELELLTEDGHVVERKYDAHTGKLVIPEQDDRD